MANAKGPRTSADLHPVSEPRREKRRSNANQVVENRHSDREEESSDIDHGNQAHPHRPPEPRVIVKVARTAKDSKEKDLAGSVRVQGTGNQKVGKCDAVGCFPPGGRERGEGWGGYVAADEGVCHGCKHCVVRCCHGLKGVCGFDTETAESV